MPRLSDASSWAQLGPAHILRYEGDKPGRVGETVIAERQCCPLRTRIDLLDAGVPAGSFHCNNLQKVFDFTRKRSESIDQLSRK